MISNWWSKSFNYWFFNRWRSKLWGDKLYQVYKYCQQCRRQYIPSDYEIKSMPLETFKKIESHGHFDMSFKFNSYCGITEHKHSGITIKDYSEAINYE